MKLEPTAWQFTPPPDGRMTATEVLATQERAYWRLPALMYALVCRN